MSAVDAPDNYGYSKLTSIAELSTGGVGNIAWYPVIFRLMVDK